MSLLVKQAIAELRTAIMDAAGLASKAQGIVFSLPVTDTAGMRLTELGEEPAPAE